MDDEEYFSTLERNTSLMVLCGEEKWIAPGRGTTSHYIVVDDSVDSGESTSRAVARRRNLEPLVTALHGDPSHISLLGGNDLEQLSDMDPDSLADIVPDR